MKISEWHANLVELTLIIYDVWLEGTFLEWIRRRKIPTYTKVKMQIDDEGITISGQNLQKQIKYFIKPEYILTDVKDYPHLFLKWAVSINHR
ncbi:MAG: hypothetical protein J7L38_00390 [Thermoproteales archaeon]|nr:hypothetical protein [Thermoproteales archaeon]